VWGCGRRWGVLPDPATKAGETSVPVPGRQEGVLSHVCQHSPGQPDGRHYRPRQPDGRQKIGNIIMLLEFVNIVFNQKINFAVLLEFVNMLYITTTGCSENKEHDNVVRVCQSCMSEQKIPVSKIKTLSEFDNLVCVGTTGWLESKERLLLLVCQYVVYI
jgi:hypothetical protein